MSAEICLLGSAIVLPSWRQGWKWLRREGVGSRGEALDAIRWIRHQLPSVG